ncbi:MAG: ferrous iron transporter B, partial [Candidatus Bathyarchaeota archaeon]
MNDERVTIALAGNANVGKSVIFNHLTGLHQHIGNWPGKTIEKAEGTLYFKGRTIDIIDLPGIYSLSTFSLEELITREYIAKEQPDLVINVVDASVLERNLFFTLQLIELETPMIIALNQMDIAKRKGVEIDHKKLAAVLGVPVIPTVAPKRTGIYELLETAATAIEEKPAPLTTIRYGEEIEEKIQELAKEVQKFSLPYPPRWTAIKLFEGDDQVLSEIQKLGPLILSKIRKAVLDIEGIHGHACPTVITSARYEAAGCVARDVQQIVPLKKPPKRERLHTITTHNVLGYLIMIGVLLFVFVGIFTFGDGVSSVLSGVFALIGQGFWTTFGTGPLETLVWGGVFEGLIAGVTIVLPYLFP